MPSTSSRSSHPSYSFTSRWTVDAGRDHVYDVLEDIGRYPEWWPEVRAVVMLGEDNVLVACRSLLPYTLHFEMWPMRRERDTGVLEAVLDGDLVGWCRWTLASAGTGTDVVFEQEVTTPGRLFRVASRLGRPLLVLNHDLMMHGGRRGLAGRTRR